MTRCMFAIMWISLCISGGFFSIKQIPINSGEINSSNIHYVALGDSIAYGYGLNDMEEDSYVGKVTRYLEQQYDHVITTNLGMNGIQSEELLERLTNSHNEFYEKYHSVLKYAKIVTISIGSNDLLHHIELDKNLEEYIENGDKIFRKECQEFCVVFPKIVQEIRKITPKAKIYANNVYNPCYGLEKYKTLYEASEKYISMFNKAFETQKGFITVDIKKIFENSEDNPLNMSLNGNKIDPHPNEWGHKLIAQEIIKEIHESERKSK